MHGRVWTVVVLLAVLGAGTGCKGSGEEARRGEGGADAGVTGRTAEAEPAYAAPGQAQVLRRDGGPGLLLEGVEEGGRRCPQGQYECCDGSCSETKGCPGLACDPRPPDRELPVEKM